MTQTGLRGGLVAGWRVFGSGPRPALALHAGLASSRAWTPVADQLGGVLTITAPDLPGHGQTARVEAGRGYVGPSTEFAEGFLDVRMDLIGHSVGAVIALDLACRYPQRVRTLTLIEPVLFAAARGTPSYKAHRSAMSGAARAWAEGNRVDAARLFVGHWGTGLAWEAYSEAERARFVDRIDTVFASDSELMDDTLGLLADGRLEMLDAQVLMIEGAMSPPIVPAILDKLAPRLNLASRHRIDGAGHMLPVTHPGPVATAIKRFLKATSSDQKS